ncbi:MAG: hypothetical protein IKY44_04000 [Clostridia bacterium]|nr:hypothetical protein [Clostridia bacterium]
MKSIILIILIIVINLSGCQRDEMSQAVEQNLENSIENSIAIKYGLDKDDFHIGSIKKVSEDSPNYYCIVNTSYKPFSHGIHVYRDFLTVWIDENYNLSDDNFMKEFQKDINSFFQNVIDDEIPGCRVAVATKLMDMQTKDWMTGDSVSEFFEVEKTYSYIDVFVNSSDDITQETIDKLCETLNFCDITLCVRNCDYFENGSESTKMYEVIIEKA